MNTLSCSLFFSYIVVSLFFGIFVGATAFKPRFQKNYTSITVALWTDIDLKCSAIADPYPVYEWTKNSSIEDGGVVIKSGHVHSIFKDNLQIKNISWSHGGSYFCNAFNSEGSEVKEFVLKVRRKYI